MMKPAGCSASDSPEMVMVEVLPYSGPVEEMVTVIVLLSQGNGLLCPMFLVQNTGAFTACLGVEG